MCPSASRPIRHAPAAMLMHRAPLYKPCLIKTLVPIMPVEGEFSISTQNRLPMQRTRRDYVCTHSNEKHSTYRTQRCRATKNVKKSSFTPPCRGVCSELGGPQTDASDSLFAHTVLRHSLSECRREGWRLRLMQHGKTRA